jgi:hypothetical protein
MAGFLRAPAAIAAKSCQASVLTFRPVGCKLARADDCLMPVGFSLQRRFV